MFLKISEKGECNCPDVPPGCGPASQLSMLAVMKLRRKRLFTMLTLSVVLFCHKWDYDAAQSGDWLFCLALVVKTNIILWMIASLVALLTAIQTRSRPWNKLEQTLHLDALFESDACFLNALTVRSSRQYP